jgi:hypothetical protein
LGARSGAGAVATRRPSARYLRRVGFNFTNFKGELIAGADLYLAESGGRDPLEMLAQSVILASYLPSFYLILGLDLNLADAERAREALRALDAKSIGVLLLRDGAPATVVKRAEPRGRPLPVGRYVELLNVFVKHRNPTRETE